MEKTVENNILLAEFLDMLTINSNGDIKEDVNSFKFHSDWNWLMQVVEKIYDTIEEVDPKYEMEWDFRIKQINNSFFFPEIEAVYNSCVEFVKWYNENKH